MYLIFPMFTAELISLQVTLLLAFHRYIYMKNGLKLNIFSRVQEWAHNLGNRLLELSESATDIGELKLKVSSILYI